MRKNLLPGYDSNFIYYIARNIIVEGEYYGTMYIGTGDYIISRTLDNIKMNGESKIFVFDQNNKLIVDTPEKNNSNYQEDKSSLDNLISNKQMPQYIKISRGVNSVTFLKTEFDWKIVMLTPIKSIRNNLRDLNRGTVIITVISILFILSSIPFAVLKAQKCNESVSRRLKFVIQCNRISRYTTEHGEESGAVKYCPHTKM